MPFTPKNTKKWSKKFQTWRSEAKLKFVRGNKLPLLVTIFAVFFLLYELKYFLYNPGSSSNVIPPVHGIFENEIQSSRPLIFPSIEHHSILRGLGIESLFTLKTDVEGHTKFIVKPNEPILTEAERKELMKTDQKRFVKLSFSDHGKLVYRKHTDSPEVVLVSLVDFERYSMEHAVRSVQNRVDYAQRHHYGLYIRWAQEFIPMLENQNVAESYEFIKPLVMRAAMFAFPQAKYFWFIDQNAVIMNFDMSLQQAVLDPVKLDESTLRSEPIIKGTNVKSYQHFNPRDAKIMVTKTPSGKIDVTSFIVTPSLYGKAFLDYLDDPLIRNYHWSSSLGHAIAHILQWHPSLLKKSAIIKPRVISATYKASSQNAEENNNIVQNYVDGDFVVTFTGCEARKSCEADVKMFYDKLTVE